MLKMDYIKPLIVTSLLYLLLYSGSVLYISIILFLVTVSITYICFTLNTQLRLEKFIAYIFIRFSFKAPAHDVVTMDDGFQRKHTRLKSLPLPFMTISQKFINSIISDFIRTWYIEIGPNEGDFLDEVEDALEYVTVGVYKQLKTVDVENILINLIRMFQRHLKVFDDCRNIVQKKYSGLNEEDLCNCITELYELGNIRHIATRSRGTQLDYLKALLDIFLFKFLPEKAFSCEGGRFMLREILTTQLLEPFIKVLTDSHFVNQAIVDILEPSVELEIIVKKWNKVIDELENSEEEHLSCEEGETSGQETDYCSGQEETNDKHATDVSIQKPVPLPVVNTNQTKNDLRNNRNKELIRFDQLDMRTSAPVYGSSSVRDHEKKLINNMKIRQSNASNAVECMHNSNKNKFSDSDNSFLSHEKSISESFNTYNSFPSREVQWPSSWTVCPSSDALLFRKSSFTEMSRKQDELSEQMKAKLSYLDLPGVKSMAWLDSVLPGYTQGPNAIPNIELQETNLQDILMLPNREEYERSLSSESVLSDVVSTSDLTHNCLMYENPFSCPLCIEMTLMASPFEIEKEKALFDPKKNSAEHECGLNSKHFYYAETNTEVPSDVPLEDPAFASCEDIVTNTASCASPALLTSKEFSRSHSVTSTVKQDSYDIVSSGNWSNSDNSLENSLSYDEVSFDIPSDEEYSHIKDGYKKSSIVTYKTAVDHGSSTSDTIIGDSAECGHLEGDDEEEDDDYDDDVGRLGQQKGANHKLKTSNKFVDFFKGINTLSKRRKLWRFNRGISKVSKDNGGGKRHSSWHGGQRKGTGMPSSSASTAPTRFLSLPDAHDNSSSCPTHIDLSHSDVNEDVEEEGLEVLEDDPYFQQLTNHGMNNTSVDPLSKEIAVCDSRKSNASTKSRSSLETVLINKKSEKSTMEEKYLPIFKGEVIQPHPSKIPAAWMYPIQMVSIPCTELAYEKGWEPGINKYTLYNIHYDIIRIWPDVHHKNVQEATVQSEGKGSEVTDTIPHIREIKRRYREFLYLHNRFTHGPLSKHMKGILRPNRRYAMPFGRMDPDVIEGRRRILETYLVSVVSRPELCNSREFKEFLGLEEHQDKRNVKTTTIAQKQVFDSQMGNIMATVKEHSHKERRGLDSQYFIHGYDVQRMFGYADKSDLQRNSSVLLKYFVNNYDTLESVHSTRMMDLPISTLELPSVSFIPPSEDTEINDLNIPLGVRTAGDGAEIPEPVVPEAERIEHSVVAAKFSPELASQLEKENLELSIVREKDLYESSWPLTDAVLSILCQSLKGYGSWMTFERVQQAILFSVGGVIEWIIKREIAEFTMKERWYMYMCNLYSLVWNEKGILKEKKAEPTIEEQQEMKEKALTSLLETIPSIIMMSIGPEKYQKCCENLLHALQYQAVNRHLLFAALEIILFDLIPELHNGFPEYTSALEK